MSTAWMRAAVIFYALVILPIIVMSMIVGHLVDAWRAFSLDVRMEFASIRKAFKDPEAWFTFGGFDDD